MRSSGSPSPDAASRNTRRASWAHVASRDSGQAQQPLATSEATPVSGGAAAHAADDAAPAAGDAAAATGDTAPTTGDPVASRPAPGSISAAGPPLHRPAAIGSTGAVTIGDAVPGTRNCNMLLGLRDSQICEADITSCGATFAMGTADYPRPIGGVCPIRGTCTVAGEAVDSAGP